MKRNGCNREFFSFNFLKLELRNEENKKQNQFLYIAGSEEDHLKNIRMDAIQLVDHVLEQSVLVVNSQQHSSNTLHSESEHFAITCDVNGDLIKSPTIESMSGKSFDDNLSVSDVTDARADSLKQNQTMRDSKQTLEQCESNFDDISSQLDIDIDDALNQREFEQSMPHFNPDEVNNFSRISWDDTVSATAADSNVITPDNVLHEHSKGELNSLIHSHT